MRSPIRWAEGGARGRGLRASALALVLALGAGSAPLALARGGGADGRFEKRTSSHFVLRQDVDIDETAGLRGSRRFEQDVLATLESAYAAIDAQLGLRPRRRIAVTVYDPRDFDARFGGRFRFPAAGFYGDSVHVRGGTVVDQQLVRTLHHELVHAALHAEAPSLVLPAWLNEGLAEWFEARATGGRGMPAPQWAWLRAQAQAGALQPLGRMSAPSFARLGPRQAQLAYLQSRAFVEYLAGRHGDRRMRDFVRELLRTGHLERAVTRSFRARLSELERDFLATLRG